MMSQADLFEEGARRRDRGRRQAIDHEAQAWKAQYEQSAGRYVMGLEPGITFTAEQVRSVVAKVTGEPHHPNVWGAMFNASLKGWARLGVVEFTGEFLDATNAQAHRRAIRLYRRK